jgi:hypothetical protein
MPEHYQDVQQGGSGNTGQATVGTSRKLTKGEAGYRIDQGIAGLQCGDCAFFQDGACQIVEGTIDEDDVCDEFEPNLKDGHMTAQQATEERQRPLSTLEMWITRVSEDKRTKVRRWYATSSGVKRDLYGERMSTALFDNFIERIDGEEKAPAPFISEAWTGGNPYLGVAHFLDLDGYGMVGTTDRVWRDGDTLKMKGTFTDSPMADAAFNAIREDQLEKRADEQRVRVSIAFIDWGHNHGKERAFTRESLSDACMLCEAGVPDKEYTAGHLVHLALTRRPAYPETEIVALEEKSMSTRRDDAASIVGEELADELEKRQKLIGRADGGNSDVATGAVVIKDEGSGEEVEGEVERTLGGAKTLDEAEAFLTKTSNGEPVLLDSWELLASVLTNIAGEDSRQPIREVLRDFQNTLDVQTAEAVLEIKRALGGESMTEETEEAVERQVPPQFRKDEEEDQKRERRPEEEEVEGDEAPEEGEADESEEDEEDEEMKEKSTHVLDSAFATVREAFDDALATPGDPGMKLGMIQESISGLGAEIQAQVEAVTANAPVDAATISRAVAEAVAPLSAAVSALQQQVSAGATVEKSSVPPRRAIKMPVASSPVNPIVRSEPQGPSDDNPTPNLRKMIRRSSVDYERQRGR